MLAFSQLFPNKEYPPRSARFIAFGDASRQIFCHRRRLIDLYLDLEVSNARAFLCIVFGCRGPKQHQKSSAAVDVLSSYDFGFHVVQRDWNHSATPGRLLLLDEALHADHGNNQESQLFSVCIKHLPPLNVW